MRPLFVRKLTVEEVKRLEQGLQSPSAFTVRRSQILLKSNQGQKAQEIAAALLYSEQTRAMGEMLIAVAKAQAKRVLVILWDCASWHKSKKLKCWLRQHNREARKQDDGVRVHPCLLPSKSPWSNATHTTANRMLFALRGR